MRHSTRRFSAKYQPKRSDLAASCAVIPRVLLMPWRSCCDHAMIAHCCARSTRQKAFLMPPHVASALLCHPPPANGTVMTRPSSDVAFSPAVKAVQAKRGSRERFAKVEEKGGWRTTVTPDLAGFLAEVRSFYLATASADGQPTSSIAAVRPGSCASSTSARWALPTSRATASTSRPAIWRRTARPSSSSWTMPSAGA